MKPLEQGSRSRAARSLLAISIAGALVLPAQAQFFSSTGANSTFPVNLFPINPASSVFDFTGNVLAIGNGGTGSFQALSGALLKGDGWDMGEGLGNGTATITGAGTRAELGGSAARLQVGNWGTGSLTISAGALVDATLNAGVCTGVAACGFNAIGNGAGSTASLTITGAGSELRTLRNLVVGQVAVFTLAHDGFDFGTPGGTTNASVNVLDGGTLRSQVALVGRGPNTLAALGTEQSFANVVIDGAGSRWLVSPNTVDNLAAGFTAGFGAGSHAVVSIGNGGKLIVDGTGGPGPNDFVNLGNAGGRADVTVSGVGSSLDVKGNSPVLQVGRAGATTQASFSILAGASASSLFLNVGRDSATGTLLIDGAGSQMNLVGVGTGAAFANIGLGGGTSVATVSNGGRIFISDGGADSRSGTGSPGFIVGRDAGGSGKLTLTGAGSEIRVVSTSLGLAPGVPDNFNPFVAVGRLAGSSGELVVSNGAKLILEGNAVSTVADSRSTTVNIGGASDTVAGGHGIALLTGAGSEIRLSGSDAFIGIGRGAGASGTLTIADQATLTGRNIAVGRSGGVGTLVVDAATVSLSGQQTGNFLSGANLSVGSGGSTGLATITNGSHVDITNLGSAGASVAVGGNSIFPLGNGLLTVAGGSQINITAASGLAVFSVARDGTGVATIQGASSVNVGDGSTYIGRLAGSNGTLVLEGGSLLTAGYVGVGRNQGGDGGTGILVVNDSTVTATTIEIGTNGFVGGNNARLNGDVILHGTLSPGNSPGSVIINGKLRTGSGLLLLDVASNGGAGLGGFDLDHVILTEGSGFDFTGLQVHFHFIGATDPGAFAAAGGFALDNFLQSLDTATGDLSGLSTAFAAGQTWDSLFDSSQFSAAADSFVITDFNFSPDGGATFNAAAIPEPGTWALLLAGLAAVSAIARRRAQRQRR